MGKTTVYVDNVHISEITRSGNDCIDTPLSLAASRSIQPKEFKKKPTPSVNVNLVAQFELIPESIVPDHISRYFHFEVRDSKGKKVAKASNGHCAGKYKFFGRYYCYAIDWENESKFSTIKITQPGVYDYTISQTDKSNSLYTVDDSVYHVRVTVKDMKSAPIVEYLNGPLKFRNERNRFAEYY